MWNLKKKELRKNLTIAAIGGRREDVQNILNSGEIDVNSFDVEGHTALQLAGLNGHAGIVQDLLKAGADVNQRVSVEGVATDTRLTKMGERRRVVPVLTRATIRPMP